MNYKSYIFKIKGKNGKEVSANKHCHDDNAAMRIARKMLCSHSCTSISVYHITEVEGREFSNYIGMVMEKG